MGRAHDEPRTPPWPPRNDLPSRPGRGRACHGGETSWVGFLVGSRKAMGSAWRLSCICFALAYCCILISIVDSRKVLLWVRCTGVTSWFGFSRMFNHGFYLRLTGAC